MCPQYTADRPKSSLAGSHKSPPPPRFQRLQVNGVPTLRCHALSSKLFRLPSQQSMQRLTTGVPRRCDRRAWATVFFHDYTMLTAGRGGDCHEYCPSSPSVMPKSHSFSPQGFSCVTEVFVAVTTLLFQGPKRHRASMVRIINTRISDFKTKVRKNTRTHTCIHSQTRTHTHTRAHAPCFL